MHFVIIFGPPAVGKMTVGLELQKLTGMPLFHNHMTIEPLLRIFPYGSPPFARLNEEFRTRIFEEAAASDLPGLIFTYVWAFDVAEDKEFLDKVTAIFTAQGAEVCYVELSSPLGERLRRNETELRLSEKPSKRNLDWSRRNVERTDQRYRMNSNGDFPYPDRHLFIDNSN
ncbi:MAG: hypothetical protein K0R39_3384, partial [Symbiobacteriaceae bacterium]|nr:hypothetical protein [Symbiobacteriaceae bacterium]